MNYYNKHWSCITQKVAWNGRSGYWKTCLDKLPSWKAKKGQEISMKFYDLAPSTCKHLIQTNKNTPNALAVQNVASPNVGNPTFDQGKSESKKIHDSFHQHEPNLHRWTSRFSRLPFFDVILLEFAGLVVALFGVWRKQGGDFLPRQPVPVHLASLYKAIWVENWKPMRSMI